MNNRLIAVTLCLMASTVFGVVQDGKSPQPLQRQIVPGSFFVAYQGQADSLVMPESFGLMGAAKVISEHRGITIVEQQVAQEADIEEIVSAASNLDSVLWAAPNYLYIGDPRENTPNDPKFKDQYHHNLMQNLKAWALKGGSADVVIAVTDDGFDLDHEDLKEAYWVNTEEIPDNGKDDDENGFIDDVNGWDFSSDDNDPNPTTGSHGTHVAGIAAATKDNKVGIVGTAAGVSIMPIRFYGSGKWTSKVIFNSYKYAADNGADIITTSFRIDQFVKDKLFNEALNYLYDRDVLQFNSAGNGNTNQSARIAFTQLLLACSTDAKDKRSSFSNYGVGVDLCAPGSNILATVPNDKYSKKSGTSMAAPNAAAVAALIMSHFPNYTRDQVAAQLLGTADNIDAKNPKYKGKLGAGRVNAYRALTEKLGAPSLIGVSSKKNVVKLQTQSVFDPESFNVASNFSIRTKTGTNISFTVPVEYRIGTQELAFETPGESLAPGTYVFTASRNLEDPFGTPMGKDFVFEFEVADPALSPMLLSNKILSLLQLK